MDTRDKGPLIAAGGGLLLFISLFLDWFDVVGSAWEFMDFVDVLLALLALTAVAIGVMLATGNSPNLPRSPGEIVTMAGIVATTIVATFILEGDELKFGIILSLIGAIAMIVGGMQLAGRVATAPRARAASDAPTQTAPPPPPPPPPASPSGGGTGGTGV